MKFELSGYEIVRAVLENETEFSLAKNNVDGSVQLLERGKMVGTISHEMLWKVFTDSVKGFRTKLKKVAK